MIIMNYGPASKYYDLFASVDDIGFYKELALKHRRKALELGVGTGRVAIELAKAGIAVWGIDNSRHMLDLAKEKLRKEPLQVRNRVTLQLGDMRSFTLEEEFPIVYIPASTFEHCITEEDQKSCLKSVSNVLERKGILAFDISQPRRGKTEGSWWIDRRELGRDEIVRTIFSRPDPHTSIVSVDLFFDVYQDGKLRERYHEYGEARVSTKNDMEQLLEESGFTVDKVYGDFDGSVYSEESRKIVYVVVMLP